MEQWKNINGYPNYMISNLGRVRNVSSNKILKNSINGIGYAVVGLSKNTIRKAFRIHRLLAQHFIPNPENKEEVNHINSIRSDYRLENLEWVTHSENIKHSFKMGYAKPILGSRHGRAKLSDDDVVSIRTKYKQYRVVDIASKFNISIGLVSLIRNRKIWTHI